MRNDRPLKLTAVETISTQNSMSENDMVSASSKETELSETSSNNQICCCSQTNRLIKKVAKILRNSLMLINVAVTKCWDVELRVILFITQDKS